MTASADGAAAPGAGKVAISLLFAPAAYVVRGPSATNLVSGLHIGAISLWSYSVDGCTAPLLSAGVCTR